MRKFFIWMMLGYLELFIISFIMNSFIEKLSIIYYIFVSISLVNLLLIPTFLIKKSLIRKLYVFGWIVCFLIQMIFFILYAFWPTGEIPAELFLLISWQSIPAVFQYHLNILLIVVLGALGIKLLYTFINRRARDYILSFSKQSLILFSLGNFVALIFTTYIYSSEAIKSFLPMFDYVGQIEFEEYENYGAHFPFSNDLTKIEAKSNHNLIHIILESTEKNFLDEELFPNLCPALKKYEKKGIIAENMDMAHNATLTFGGMYAAFTGKWLSIVSRQYSIFLKAEGNVVSFPFVLKQAGYTQVFIYGHHNSFKGFEEYLALQGFLVKRIGKSSRLVADEDVFSEALKEFRKLSAEKKPFNLTLLTVNAHAPNGVVQEGQKLLKYIPEEQLEPSRLLDVLHTTDAALGHFLDEVSKDPVFKDTTIVIQSDHLSHPNTIQSVQQQLSKKNRKMLFLILNSVKNKKITQPSMTFDIAPTILSAMGVQHNATFLFGEDLFNDKLNVHRLNYSEKQEKINSYLYTSDMLKIKKIFIKNDNGKVYLMIDGDKMPVVDSKTQLAYDGISKKWCILPISSFNKYESVMLCYDTKPATDSNQLILYGVSGKEEQSLLGIKIPPHSTYLIFKKSAKNIIHHILPINKNPYIEL